MATSVRITAGYDSANHKDEIWEKLVEVAKSIANDCTRVATSALECGAPRRCPCGHCNDTLLEYCDIYKGYENAYELGCPLTIHAEPTDVDLIIDGDEDDFVPCLYISISGDTPTQTMKYHAARAFCRLVIEDMNRANMNVNVVWG